MSGLELLTSLSVAATGLSALGQIRSAQAAAQTADANAATARVNAGMQLNAAEAEAARIERTTQRRVATARNEFGATGIDTSSGSPLDVMGDMAAEGALDKQIARWRGSTQAAGSQTVAAQQDAARGNAMLAGTLGATTSILTGASNMLSQRAYARALAGRSEA